MRTPRSNRRIGVGMLGLLVIVLTALHQASRVAPGIIGAPLLTSVASDPMPPAHSVRFVVEGDLEDLAPGTWREVPVRIGNPSSVPLRLTGVTLTVASDSTPAGCLTEVNLEIRQPRFTPGRVLPLPPRGTVTLPADGVSTGAIRLRDLPTVNQDACKGKSFSLTWSGTAEQ